MHSPGPLRAPSTPEQVPGCAYRRALWSRRQPGVHVAAVWGGGRAGVSREGNGVWASAKAWPVTSWVQIHFHRPVSRVEVETLVRPSVYSTSGMDLRSGLLRPPAPHTPPSLKKTFSDKKCVHADLYPPCRPGVAVANKTRLLPLKHFLSHRVLLIGVRLGFQMETRK